MKERKEKVSKVERKQSSISFQGFPFPSNKIEKKDYAAYILVVLS